ncbi:hypothetical protein BXZ70DRAFT_949644 [Cristinia sonorae]|uniref:F-box domain-containing protein n=1 Tax=Cristinia sonorae TaxID=1940300 RepID=A0A8K0XMJ2_9AGAR|nr:hypothetical protein BXZ70DRAFT_949644 [Cristinia sonorae]
MSSLQDLPHELIERIFLEADAETIARCRQVCRHLNLVATQSIAVQYKAELGMVGFEDGPSEGLTPAERLERLQRRKAAWREMKPSNTRVITAHKAWWKTVYGDHMLWVSSPKLAEKKLHVLRIPSVIRGIAEKEWSFDIDTNLDKLDAITMDPAQNLVILPQNDGLSVRCMSTGVPHPSAVAPELPLDLGLGELNSRDIENMAVSENYVGATVVLDTTQRIKQAVVIFDWKSGNKLLQLEETSLNIGFAFLTNQYLLLAHLSAKGSVVLSVIDIHAAVATGYNGRSVSCSDIPSVCRLELPRSRSPPKELRIETSPAHRKRYDIPFHPSSNDQIFAVVIGDYATTLLLPRSTIMDHLRKVVSGERRPTSPWAEWSSSKVALFDHSTVWSVNGMTTVMEPPAITDPEGDRRRDEGSDGEVEFYLYDFASLEAQRLAKEKAQNTGVKKSHFWTKNKQLEKNSTVQYRETFMSSRSGYDRRDHKRDIYTKFPAKRISVPKELWARSYPDEVHVGDDCMVFVYEDRDEFHVCHYEIMSF